MQRTRREIGVFALWLLAAFVPAPCAVAAPTLDVEAHRFPGQVHRGDESLAYEVEVRNTAGLDAASGVLDLTISMSPGLSPRSASGPGWSCSADLSKCTSSAAVPAGGSYPVLELSPVSIAATASDAAHVVFTASGGGAAAAASAEDTIFFAPAVPFGLAASAVLSDEAGGAEHRAGAHPFEVSGTFEIPRRQGPLPDFRVPVEPLRSGVAELPSGLVANPEAMEATCGFVAIQEDECPPAAAVGGIRAFLTESEHGPTEQVAYRLPGEAGYPTLFGFKVEGELVYVIRVRLRSDGDYGVSQVLPLIPQNPSVYGIGFTFCGYGVKLKASDTQFERCKRRTDPGVSPKPFLTLGTACADGPPLIRFAIDSWLNRGVYTTGGLPDLSDPAWKQADVPFPSLTGCARLSEEWTGVREPSLRVQPGGGAADSPVAYTASLHIPQDGLTDRDGLATAHLKDATVALPLGVSLNPPFADGLSACSEEQIGLIGNGFPSPNPVHFDMLPPHCPLASKIGTASLSTPLFRDPLPGSIYLATQGQNPFGSDYAVYVVVEAAREGVMAKLPGRIDLDPATGQVKARFFDGPQIPFEDLELKLFGGQRAALSSPVTCGDYRATASLTPWSAPDPDRPAPGEIARPSAAVPVSTGPGGAACVADPAERPFDVDFTAGARDAVAGASTPLLARVTRADGAQELSRLEISPPPGFTASLRGVPFCPEAAIAAAVAASARSEQQSPSCPAASRVGGTQVGAGAGATPLYLAGGLYLAGPYRGAPISLVAITPAAAGPFDLGTAVVRAAVRIDRQTTRLTAITDPLPRILAGVPLRIRDVRISLDRPGWSRNPTSCEERSIDLVTFGSDGAVARSSDRFQVGGCAALGFRPRLSLRFAGAPTRRGGHPSVRAVLRARPGDADIGRAVVTLPPTELLDSTHIRGICPRARFEAESCAAGSIYGHVKVWSPLLDRPLQGPVYLRSSDRRLPDLAIALDGQFPIVLTGHLDSVRGRVRATLPAIPDIPVNRFQLTLRGGRRGLLVNNTQLCRADPRAGVLLRGHNDAIRVLRRPVKVEGCGPDWASRGR